MKTILKINQYLKSINPYYIIIGCIGIMILSYIFIFSGSSKYKIENNMLKQQVKEIQVERDSINKSIKILKDNYVILEKSRNDKENEILIVDEKLRRIESNLNQSFIYLNDIKGGVTKINNDIKIREQNPILRVGDSLINSLSKKLN